VIAANPDPSRPTCSVGSTEINAANAALGQSTVTFTSAFLKPTKIAVVMLAAQAAMFGMLTVFLFILDEQFLGQTSASPQPFVRVYARLSETQTTGKFSSPDTNSDDEEGDQ
jgi:hypothetical protein